MRHHWSTGAAPCTGGDCFRCEDLVARYWGESGDSGHCRTFSLVTAVERGDKEDTMMNTQ